MGNARCLRPYHIIDIPDRSSAGVYDCVVVTVIDDQHSARPEHRCEISEGCTVVLLGTFKVWKMGKGVADADDGIITFTFLGDILWKGEPVGNLDFCGSSVFNKAEHFGTRSHHSNICNSPIPPTTD